MKFTSSKIARIGQCELNDVALACRIFNSLDQAVIEKIENGGLYLWIYAEIFRECLLYENEFSNEVYKRLCDNNYLCGKMAEYEKTHR